MSTHSIGPVRLLFGSLALMLVGAALCWWLYVRVAGEAVLVIRDGSFEVEPWVGTLQQVGVDSVWDHNPTEVELAIYRSTGDEDELELGEPVKLSGVKSIRVDFRVAGTLAVTEAVQISMKDGRLKMSVRNGQLLKRGDVWVHQGFGTGRQETALPDCQAGVPGSDRRRSGALSEPGCRQTGKRFRIKLIAPLGQ